MLPPLRTQHLKIKIKYNSCSATEAQRLENIYARHLFGAGRGAGVEEGGLGKLAGGKRRPFDPTRLPRALAAGTY